MVNKFKINEDSLLRNCYYAGSFVDNRFQGNGTIFMGGREKFSSKFEQGTPMGTATYYNTQGESEVIDLSM